MGGLIGRLGGREGERMGLPREGIEESLSGSSGERRPRPVMVCLGVELGSVRKWCGGNK